MYDSCVRRGIPRPRSQPSCSACAPVSIVSYAPIVPAPWARPPTRMGHWPHQCGQCPDAEIAPVAGSLAQGFPPRLRVVPNALEWRDPGGAQLAAKHSRRVSTETIRRCLHKLDWVWKRAKLIATATDPQRIAWMARIRFHFEHLEERDVMVLADELDYTWIPKGAREFVMTTGQHTKPY